MSTTYFHKKNKCTTFLTGDTLEFQGLFLRSSKLFPPLPITTSQTGEREHIKHNTSQLAMASTSLSPTFSIFPDLPTDCVLKSRSTTFNKEYYLSFFSISGDRKAWSTFDNQFLDMLIVSKHAIVTTDSFNSAFPKQQGKKCRKVRP